MQQRRARKQTEARTETNTTTASVSTFTMFPLRKHRRANRQAGQPVKMHSQSPVSFCNECFTNFFVIFYIFLFLFINAKKLNSLKQCLTATRPTSHN